MKFVLSFILMVFISIGPSFAEWGGSKYGDINNDDTVNILDAVVLINLILYPPPKPPIFDKPFVIKSWSTAANISSNSTQYTESEYGTNRITLEFYATSETNNVTYTFQKKHTGDADWTDINIDSSTYCNINGGNQCELLYFFEEGSTGLWNYRVEAENETGSTYSNQVNIYWEINPPPTFGGPITIKSCPNDSCDNGADIGGTTQYGESDYGISKIRVEFFATSTSSTLTYTFQKKHTDDADWTDINIDSSTYCSTVANKCELITFFEGPGTWSYRFKAGNNGGETISDQVEIEWLEGRPSFTAF